MQQGTTEYRREGSTTEDNNRLAAEPVDSLSSRIHLVQQSNNFRRATYKPFAVRFRRKEDQEEACRRVVAWPPQDISSSHCTTVRTWSTLRKVDPCFHQDDQLSFHRVRKSPRRRLTCACRNFAAHHTTSRFVGHVFDKGQGRLRRRAESKKTKTEQ
jgi:hypothetical protein